MVSRGLRPVGLRFIAYILGATRTWHVQHEFSDCRRDIVFVRHKDNLLTREVQQKSKLSSFQSLAPGLQDINILSFTEMTS